MSGITEGIATSINAIASGLGKILDKIVALRDDFIAALKESDNLVTRFWGNLFDKVAGLQDAVIGKFQDLLDWTADFRQAFFDKIKELIDFGADNWKKFFNWTAEIRQFFLDKFTDLFQKLMDIRDYIVVEIPLAIYKKMKSLFEYFFVPDADLMNERLEHINSKFAFVESVTGYGEHLINFLQNAAGTKAPVVTLDLGAYRGAYGWGKAGKVTIDFSWYAEYKPLVDNLLAGIIWVHFLWHAYKRIPEIIHGMGMTADRAIDISGRDID